MNIETLKRGNDIIFMSELNRIKEVYDRRKEEVPKGLYSYFNKANLTIIHERERVILDLLDNYEMNPLLDKKALDIGCGKGGALRDFIRWGATPENLYGVDLLENRIKDAKSLSPNIDLRCGNAEELPFPDEFFDIVIQFTVFTSIIDLQMKKNIAREMRRVLKRKGIILWYDYHVNNPKNPDVKGVRKKEIYQLFPDCEIHFKRVTVAPPITRLIAPYSHLLCSFLELLKFLNTHYVAVIKKK